MSSRDRPPDPHHDQTIDHNTIADSTIQQNQAGRDALSFQNSSHNQTTINNVVLGFASRSQPQVDWHIARRILDEFQLPEIRSRLHDSLMQEQHFWVDWQEQPQQVNRSPLAAKQQLRIAGKDTEALEPGKLIIEAFGRSDIRGKLLILGAPGAGKTTLLLSLAEQLVCGALNELQTVIPIIFELSTWKDDRQSIRDWLIEQLYEIYGGDRKTKRYEQWLDQQVLLPLLDGLDELGLERQIACAKKLNEFAQHYPQLVVCCRVKEYEAAGAQLDTLRGAVCLQPLSDEQIQDYLNKIERPSLWQAIQDSPEMRQLLEPMPDEDVGLLRVPLFMAIAASVFDPQHPFRSKAELLEQYIEKQLAIDTRRSDRRYKRNVKWAYKTVETEPTYQETCRYLSWLASKLTATHQINLLVENMQPDWLDAPQQRKQYQLINFLTLWSIPILIFALWGGLYGLILGLCVISDLINQFTSGQISKLNENEEINPIERFHISISNLKHRKITHFLKQCLIGGLLFGMAAGLFSWLGNLFIVSTFIGGFLIVLYVGLILGFIEAFKADLKLRFKPNQGIWKSLQNFFLVSFFGFSLITLMLTFTSIIRQIERDIPLQNIPSFIIHDLPQSLIFSLFISLFSAFWTGGGIAFVRHFLLRVVLAHNHLVPWRLVPFFNYCVERRLLQRIGGRYRFIHRELLEHFAQFHPSQL